MGTGPGTAGARSWLSAILVSLGDSPSIVFWLLCMLSSLLFLKGEICLKVLLSKENAHYNFLEKIFDSSI